MSLTYSPAYEPYYYTVGDDEEPTFTIENDPRHCFDNRNDAFDEIEYLLNSKILDGPLNVWYVKGTEKRIMEERMT